MIPFTDVRLTLYKQNFVELGCTSVSYKSASISCRYDKKKLGSILSGSTCACIKSLRVKVVVDIVFNGEADR